MCLLEQFITRDLGEGDMGNINLSLLKCQCPLLPTNDFKFPTLRMPSTGVRVKRHAALAFFPVLTPVCDNHGTSFRALCRLACVSVPAGAMRPSWSQ